MVGCLRRALGALLAALLGTGVTSGSALAEIFDIGPVDGILDVTLAYGLMARTEERDLDFIGSGNDGNAESVNFDDGNLNYDTGVLANEIRLSADRLKIQAGGDDLCYITAEVLDAAGNPHPTAEDLLLFTIQGPGKLLAVGSSNPTSEEMYTGSQRKAHRGRSLVVIQSRRESGEITLRAQADGLKQAEIKIQSVQ